MTGGLGMFGAVGVEAATVYAPFHEMTFLETLTLLVIFGYEPIVLILIVTLNQVNGDDNILPMFLLDGLVPRRAFAVGYRRQMNPRETPILPQHRVNHFSFVGGVCFAFNVWDNLGLVSTILLQRVIQVVDDWPVFPSTNILVYQWLPVDAQHPSVAIVNQLLDLQMGKNLVIFRTAPD